MWYVYLETSPPAFRVMVRHPHCLSVTDQQPVAKGHHMRYENTGNFGRTGSLGEIHLPCNARKNSHPYGRYLIDRISGYWLWSDDTTNNCCRRCILVLQGGGIVSDNRVKRKLPHFANSLSQHQLLFPFEIKIPQYIFL